MLLITLQPDQIWHRLLESLSVIAFLERGPHDVHRARFFLRCRGWLQKSLKLYWNQSILVLAGRLAVMFLFAQIFGLGLPGLRRFSSFFVSRYLLFIFLHEFWNKALYLSADNPGGHKFGLSYDQTIVTLPQCDRRHFPQSPDHRQALSADCSQSHFALGNIQRILKKVWIIIAATQRSRELFDFCAVSDTTMRHGCEAVTQSISAGNFLASRSLGDRP